jgi:hypothetical protein
MGRRSFARSVVVTISLAEVAVACGSGKEPLPGNPPPPEEKAAKKVAPAEPPPRKAPEIERKSPGTNLPPEEPSGYAEVNPYPPPKNRIQGENVATQLQQEGRCIEQRRMECPPGKHCNPPPPRVIECPKELALPKAKHAETVWQKRDRMCWEPEAGACTPGTDGCEDPKARRVVCPDSMQPPEPPEAPDDDDGHHEP